MRTELLIFYNCPVRKVLYVLSVCAAVLVCSCAHGTGAQKQHTDSEPGAGYSPSEMVLEQTIAHLETMLSEREDQLAALQERVKHVVAQRDVYAEQAKKAADEVSKLRVQNDVLNKKIEEIFESKSDPLPIDLDIYVVQPGDTLMSIAGRQEVYGDRSLWRDIFEENRDVLGSASDPLMPGTKLIIPRP